MNGEYNVFIVMINIMHCRLLKISSIYRGFSNVLKTIELASMENQ